MKVYFEKNKCWISQHLYTNSLMTYCSLFSTRWWFPHQETYEYWNVSQVEINHHYSHITEETSLLGSTLSLKWFLPSPKLLSKNCRFIFSHFFQFILLLNYFLNYFFKHFLIHSLTQLFFKISLYIFLSSINFLFIYMGPSHYKSPLFCQKERLLVASIFVNHKLLNYWTYYF